MKVIKYFNITAGTAMIRILQSETGIIYFFTGECRAKDKVSRNG
jgi:hypothetical protein